MRLDRVSLVCDDLQRMADFWQDRLGIAGRETRDPLNPERRLLTIGMGGEVCLEYVWFPGMPGGRGSGDLHRLEFAGLSPALWQRLQQVAEPLPIPGSPLALLDPSGVLLVFHPPAGADPGV